MSALRSQASYNPIDVLLPRLDGLMQTGKGWRARCPSHGGKTRTLSICEGNDGRLLLHCFAGCQVIDVLTAIGLDVGDLFIRRDLRTMTPQQQRELQQAARIPKWSSAVDVLSIEASILLIAATQLGEGQSLHAEDLSRLRMAAMRIFDAQEVLRAR
ncbi:hypothetical protein [Dyella sp. RRB7]|uniref:hypothetical protein n=1 Tax=Dyella sp. RRB7 TaxID=2919502 RepID=UPI001FAB02A8|nr:hypothetical protein [Dyella sp. RRB7]